MCRGPQHYVGWSAMPVAVYRSIPRFSNLATDPFSIRLYKAGVSFVDAAEPSVFCLGNARDDHGRFEQRLALGRIHDHPVDQNAARDDVISVQLRSTRPQRCCACLGRRDQARPTPDDGVQDRADLAVVSDVADTDGFDVPMLGEFGHSLRQRDPRDDGVADPTRNDVRRLPRPRAYVHSVA